MVTGDDGRPQLHFTADRGWINDPHGLVYVDGRYHLFFQYVPDEPVWSPRIQWGHASSPDLLSWQEHGAALVPEPPETGCWSGSLVRAADGPVIFYTSASAVAGPAWNIGAVVAAPGSADLMSWPTARRRVVLTEPPAGSGVDIFRDPFVRRHGDGWIMLVGARLAGEGAIVQFSSPDLEHWTYDGPMFTAGEAGEVPHHLGNMWECPQLLRIGEDWVALVSVWHDDQLHHVLYAVGGYDGRRFRPRSWGRFDHGPVLYATSVFTDAEGRPCAVSWLREDADTFDPAQERRAGAHSMPVELALAGDRLVARFHRNLDDRCRRRESSPVTADTTVLAVPRRPARVRCTGLPSGAGLGFTCGAAAIEITLDAVGLTVQDAAGRVLAAAPRSADGPGDIDVLLDGNLLEATVGVVDGLVACRSGFAGAAPTELTVRGGTGATVTVEELSADVPA